MSQAPQDRPNTDQITYWNDESGPKWVALQQLLDEQIAPLGLAAMERAAVRTGEHVLDVGCGCGQTSLQLAERVGAGGSVSGVDISAVMLERARERATSSGLENVSFTTADAQVHDFEAGRYDLVFSRFGVMFFSDPVAAFANLRSALRPGGRLAFVCWQEVGRNPWMLVPVMAVAAHVTMPPPPEEGAPGPFAFADPARVRDILAGAGFVDIEVAGREGTLALAGEGDVDAAVDFVVQLGPAGRLFREAHADTQAKLRTAIREALVPYATPDGVVLGCATHVVTATAPPQK
jgi:SAM-dependent methyltransferase